MGWVIVAILAIIIGLLEDLAPLLAVLAIVLVIYGIYISIKNSINRKRQQEEEEERQRLNKVENEVARLVAKFTPKKLTQLKEGTTYTLSVSSDLLNKAVISQVKKYKKDIANSTSEYRTISSEINNLLACNGSKDPDYKLDYLTKINSKLLQMKEVCDKLYLRIANYQIRLLNEDTDVMASIRGAYRSLSSSKKCVFENEEYKDFVTTDAPAELTIFKYKFAPVILFVNHFYYCLFSNVVLVFDRYGVFTTALDPTAIKILVKYNTDSVTVWNDRFPGHKHIDSDSKCVEQGTIRTTYLHTCRDGTIDLRYSHNPRMTYMTNTYQYATITIQILAVSVTFTASSEITATAFEQAKRKYAKRFNQMHDPIPDLLSLLECVESSDHAKNIQRTYASGNKGSNYFCEIVGQ